MCLGIDVRGLLHFLVPEGGWLKHPSASEGKLDAFRSFESAARFFKFSTAWFCLSVVVQQLVVILVLFQEKSVHPSTLSFWDSQLIGKVPDAGKD